MVVSVVAGKAGQSPERYDMLNTALNGVADSVEENALDAHAAPVAVNIKIVFAGDTLQLIAL